MEFFQKLLMMLAERASRPDLDPALVVHLYCICASSDPGKVYTSTFFVQWAILSSIPKQSYYDEDPAITAVCRVTNC